MTVATTTNKATFNGSGSAGPFPFTFKFWNNSEIDCMKTVAGVDIPLTESVHYTLTGAGVETGGSVTLASALAVGEKLTILRTLPFTQETDLPNNGPFFAQTLEDTFDKLEMQIQQLAETNARAFKLSASNSSGGVLELAKSDIASKLLSFDAAGNLTVYDSSYTIVVEQGAAGVATVVYADASIADVSVTLPASGEVVVIKTDATNHIVTVSGDGGSTVTGGAPCILTVQGEFVRLLYRLAADNWDQV